MLRNRTAEVTIELKAVVETRYSMPYIQAKIIEAMVVRRGKFILSSIWEKYLEKGTPFCKVRSVSVLKMRAKFSETHVTSKGPSQTSTSDPLGGKRGYKELLVAIINLRILRMDILK